MASCYSIVRVSFLPCQTEFCVPRKKKTEFCVNIILKHQFLKSHCHGNFDHFLWYFTCTKIFQIRKLFPNLESWTFFICTHFFEFFIFFSNIEPWSFSHAQTFYKFTKNSNLESWTFFRCMNFLNSWTLEFRIMISFVNSPFSMETK